MQQITAIQHYKRPVERPFTKAERPHTTILFGGLTYTHDFLLEGALKGLGYNAKFLPIPDNNSLSIGKEYGNRGQCNPTYYTVGNLIKYLQRLRKSGEEDVEKRFVFFTAGSCGPCRFGMYEAEYRKALRDAGFPDFRVLLFQQSAGLNQREESGLELNPRFFITLIKTIMIGDMINELGYKIRPYEVEKGKTDRVIEESRNIIYSSLKEKGHFKKALKFIKDLFSSIKTDYSRIKPKVKITGEFWAMTTEGDGSYKMQRWLEAEGAEVISEPVSNWVQFMIWEGLQHIRERKGIRKGYISTMIQLKIAAHVFKFYYNRFRASLGFRPDPLPPQERIAEYARNYYNTHISGGESYMEIGKHVMSFLERKAHLVLSIKPFGCMPSTQSDGVQAKVITDLKESIFVSIETSGDSEVNVRSRVQMKLYEARERARKEVMDLLNKYGLTIKQVEEYSMKHPCYGLSRLPHYVAATAGNYIEMKAGDIARHHNVRQRPILR